MLAGTARPADLSAQVDGYRAQHESAIVGQLDELTRLRSVAADPGGITATADRLQKLLTERGFEARQFSAGSGTPPLVFGVMKTPGAKPINNELPTE